MLENVADVSWKCLTTKASNCIRDI